MKKLIASMCLCLLLMAVIPAVGASALTATIDIMSSDIETALSQEGFAPEAVTTLNVKGSMKPKDYSYIMTDLKNLKTLHLADETFIPTKAFYDSDADKGHPMLQLVTAPCARTVGTRSFYKMPNLYRVQMSEAADIGYQAFSDCPRLTTVNFANCVTVAESAFENCPSLKSVSIPNTSVIDNNAFSGDKSLTTINMKKIEHIKDGVFNDCDSLVNVEVNASEIGANAFSNCDSLTRFSAPRAATLHSGVLSNCPSLTSVSIPSAVRVGSGAFENDSSLVAITIGDVMPVFDSAWKNCFKGTPATLKIYTQGQYTGEQCAELLKFIKDTGGPALEDASILLVLPTENNANIPVNNEPTIDIINPVTNLLEMIKTDDMIIREWSSSDENIASVDANGLVTAKNPGSAVITARVSDTQGTGLLKDIQLQVDVVDNEGRLAVTVKKLAEKIINEGSGNISTISEAPADNNNQPEDQPDGGQTASADPAEPGNQVNPADQTKHQGTDAPATADMSLIALFACIMVFGFGYLGMKYSYVVDNFAKKVKGVFAK